jgi:hypothetical protein
MNSIDLFSSRVFKTRIDPNSYNKDELVKVVISNYEKNPKRNAWDQNCDIHHYYNDWENSQYDTVPTQQLNEIYQQEIVKFHKEVNPSVSWQWNLENIAVNTNYMVPHNHLWIENGYATTYSCIHYIKFNPTYHRGTEFENPAYWTEIKQFTEKMQTGLNSSDIKNSNFFSGWVLDVEEDDMIFFPSYLKHKVHGMIEEKEHRIVGVVNINWAT